MQKNRFEGYAAIVLAALGLLTLPLVVAEALLHHFRLMAFTGAVTAYNLAQAARYVRKIRRYRLGEPV